MAKAELTTEEPEGVEQEDEPVVDAELEGKSEPKPSKADEQKTDADNKAKAIEALRKKMESTDLSKPKEDDGEPPAPEEKPKAKATPKAESRETVPDLDERQMRAATFAGLSLDEARTLASQHPALLEKFARSQEAVDRKMAEAGRTAATAQSTGEKAEAADADAGGKGDSKTVTIETLFSEDEDFIPEPLAEKLNELVATHNAMAEVIAEQQRIIAGYDTRFQTEDRRRESDERATFWESLDSKIYTEFGEGTVEAASDEGHRRTAVEEKAAGLRRGFPEMGFTESLNEALAIIAGRTAEQRRLMQSARARGAAISARPPTRRGRGAEPRTPEEEAIAAVGEQMKKMGLRA